jgi:hypothetical protein
MFPDRRPARADIGAKQPIPRAGACVHPELETPEGEPLWPALWRYPRCVLPAGRIPTRVARQIYGSTNTNREPAGVTT